MLSRHTFSGALYSRKGVVLGWKAGRVRAQLRIHASVQLQVARRHARRKPNRGMPNHLVVVHLDGVPHICKLTLGALAELEDALQEGSLVDLVHRFESGRFRARDVLALVLAGLRGGGWAGSADDLRKVEITGGPTEAARAAA